MSPQQTGCPSHAEHDRNLSDFDLLSPIKIRGQMIKNRIALTPMCQYSAKDGFADDWHLVHLGSRAVGGAGLIFVEATAITAQGRISPGDLGIWSDSHIEPLARIASFVHRMGATAAIQLAHAGRKGSCAAPWEGGHVLKKEQGGWEIIAPSPIAFEENGLIPLELNQTGIDEVIQAFKNAAMRAIKAQFKIIEIHAAHGYLLHQFLSPISNQRKDAYGGNLENRSRLLCQVITEIRKIIPEQMPLFVRISATDWVEGGWDLDQSIQLAKIICPLGVDFIDVSSGGSVPHVKIPVGRNYQVPFSAAIRSQTNMLTGAVGLITDPLQANEIVTSGQADLVFIGREFLREPYWTLKAEATLNQDTSWPLPYGYAVKRRK